MMINMIIKAQRGGSSARDGVRKRVLPQQLGGVVAATRGCRSKNWRVSSSN